MTIRVTDNPEVMSYATERLTVEYGERLEREFKRFMDDASLSEVLVLTEVLVSRRSFSSGDPRRCEIADAFLHECGIVDEPEKGETRDETTDQGSRASA